MTTEKVTTSDEVHKHTDNFTTSEEVVKGTDEVKKLTENITTNDDIDKGTEKLEYIKEPVVTIRRKYSYKFEVQSKVSTGWYNLDGDFFKRKCSTIEPYFYKKTL